MRKFILIIIGLMLSSCCLFHRGFVDERFNHLLVSQATHPWDIRLTPTAIISDNRLGTQEIMYDCKLLENRIGFLKYECQGMQYTGELVELQPGISRITFEIEEWDKYFKMYPVIRTNYDWSVYAHKWSTVSGTYVFIDEKK